VFGRALKHRAVAASASPESVVHIIIGDTSGLKMPRLRGESVVIRHKHRVPSWSDQNRSVLFFPAQRGVAVYNHKTSNAFLWMPSVSAIPWWENASPLQWFHDLAATQFGQATIHAAAVGKGGKGVLIAGQSGAGKSTLAMACLGAGLDFAGDDYCVAELGSLPVCHSLYNTAKWKNDARVVPKWLETVPAEVVDRSNAKGILYVAEYQPTRIALELDVSAIIVPRQAGNTVPRLERCKPETAFRALAPSTLFQSEAEGRQVIDIVSGLIRQLPAYLFHMSASSEDCGAYLAENLDTIL
jgi:energy-coupling factor transporter ATP-binding protein EcfA2